MANRPLAAAIPACEAEACATSTILKEHSVEHSAPDAAHSGAPSPGPRRRNFLRDHPVWSALCLIVVVIAAVLALFDWNWVRPPLERYISARTHREFRASNLDVKLGMNPTIRLDNLVFANSDWGEKQPMAAVKRLEFTVSLRDLLDHRVLIPRVAISNGDFLLERLPDGRKNWVLSDPIDKSPSRLRISTLSVDNGHLHYIDHGMPFDLDVAVNTFDSTKQEQVKSADAGADNSRYSTRYDFHGKYHDAGFSGTAFTGEVFSFEESNQLFPIKGSLHAGTTRLDVEGSVADVVNISAIDVNLHIAGLTMANIYPFLLLPLPASPPYDVAGRLKYRQDHFAMDDLKARIGSTDLHGSASYVQQKPRPLLAADLHSNNLNMGDLGPLIGVKTKPALGKPRLTQAETNTREQAAAAGRERDSDKVLPAGTFESSRLKAIDADVNLETRNFHSDTALPIESLSGQFHLHDGLLKLTPLDVGFAGGTIAAQITLDARQSVIASRVQADFRQLQLAKLFPHNQTVSKAAGTLGARMDLAGNGDSIADAAAKANGSISAVIADGRISNLIDAASALNGGKVLRVLMGGDKDIEVNCGAVDFDIRNGQGSSKVFLVDTEQTEITGNGNFDLAHERFNLEVAPKPKNPDLLSLRTPIRLYGSFRNPDYELEKGPLVAKAGAALALAVVNPLAGLLPLVEPGPGVSTDCRELLHGVAPASKDAANAKRPMVRPAPQPAPDVADRQRKEPQYHDRQAGPVSQPASSGT
jgi:uncharacterized protein involved in outer membrane biogenesis